MEEQIENQQNVADEQPIVEHTADDFHDFKLLEKDNKKFEEKPKDEPPVEKSSLELLLEKYGATDADDLEEKIKSNVKLPIEKTEAEKIDDAERENLNFYKYSIENKLLNSSDIENAKLQEKNKQDILSLDNTQLVFDNFKKEIKAENADITDEEIEEEFNDLYKIGSDGIISKKAKSLLEKEANEIKKSLLEPLESNESKIKEAKQQFEKNKEYLSNIPKYKGIVEKEISKLEVGFEIDGFKVVPTKEELEEARSYLNRTVGNEYLDKVVTGEVKDLPNDINEFLNAFIKTRSFDKIIKNSIAYGKSLATKEQADKKSDNSYNKVNKTIIDSKNFVNANGLTDEQIKAI